MVSDEWHGNKVSGEHDQIGTKAVDHGNRGVQRMDRKVRIVVKIAEQSDRKAIQPFRPARQEKILAHDARTVRLEQYSIRGKRDGASGDRPAKKLASCGRKRRQKDLTQQEPGPSQNNPNRVDRV